MAKDPILPLYYNDLNSSTEHWTDEEFGAYMRLLIHQWDKGSIPDDMKRLLKIADSAKRNWKLLESKFSKSEDGLLRNPVMERVRESRRKFKDRQKTNIQNRYQTPTKDPTKPLPESYQTTYQNSTKELPIEAENEIRKEVQEENKIDALVYHDAEQEISKNHTWLEQLCMTKTKKPMEAVLRSLRKYHLWLIEKERYPIGRKQMFAGFERWIMNEKVTVEPEKEIVVTGSPKLRKIN